MAPFPLARPGGCRAETKKGAAVSRGALEPLGGSRFRKLPAVPGPSSDLGYFLGASAGAAGAAGAAEAPKK